MRKKGSRTTWHARAKAMARQGLNSPAIARACGVSRQRVGEVLHAAGITTPAMRVRRARGAERPLKYRWVRFQQRLIDDIETLRRQLERERDEDISWSETLRLLAQEAIA